MTLYHLPNQYFIEEQRWVLRSEAAILIKHQNLFRRSDSFHISRPKALIFSILLNKVGSFSLANKANRINL